MKDTVRLGRIAGVRIGVNWSVFAIFLLIAVGLGAGRFPAVYPDRNAGLYVVAALAAGLVFFASLLAHELAHAVVARRNGVEVEGITLWLLGGLARLRGEAPDPGAELRIAGVGPAVSALLAVGFAALAALLAALGDSGLDVGVLAWLAAINAILAVFNIIPAAPLDGGRLLRAVLWRRSNDKLAASITAARTGRVLGFVLLALGLAQFLSGAGFGGLWLALIGLFLVQAATMEEHDAQARRTLAGVRVSEVMSAGPVVVPDDPTVSAFIDRYVSTYRQSAYPMVDVHGRPSGIVMLDQVQQVEPELRDRVRLGSVAYPLAEVPVVNADDLVADLLPRLGGAKNARYALVMRDGALVGIVSPSDVVWHLERSRLLPGPTRPPTTAWPTR